MSKMNKITIVEKICSSAQWFELKVDNNHLRSRSIEQAVNHVKGNTITSLLSTSIADDIVWKLYDQTM